MDANRPNPVNLPGLVFKAVGILLFAALVAFVANYKLKLGPVPSIIVALSIFGVGLYSMLKLRGAPREMGVTFGLKFFSVTAYKILNFLVSMWLIRHLGFNEQEAGYIIVAWGLLMTVCTIVAGSLTDALGLRRTLFLGVTISVLTRLVMALATNKGVALVCGLMPLAIGEALCTPVLVAAMRLYAKPSQRTVAFSLFYALMNFGFMFGYFISDGVMGKVKVDELVTVPVLGWNLSAFSVLILVSMAVDLVMIPLIWFLKPGVQMTEAGFVPLPSKDHIFPPGTGVLGRLRLTVVNAASDTVATLGRLFMSKGFAGLLVFLLMIGLLKIVFNVMDYVLNPFVTREIGAVAVSKVGRLNATNSIMILVLAPMVGILTRKYASYTMVIIGGFITAASFIFMCAPTSMFESLASGWLGKGIGNGYLGIVGDVHPYFIMIFLWQVMFSIGEAFYSPRVYEYAASIAPPGQEASYSSLSYIPLLIGKISTGLAFGSLLNHYCPKEGPRNSGMMWLIIGGMVLVAPLGLLFLQRFIRVPEAGREDS